MQYDRSQSPLPQDLTKRRRTNDSPGQSFSNAEQRVLEHAADILRIPIKVLLSLNSPLSEILSENARSQPKTPLAPRTTIAENNPPQPNALPAPGHDWLVPSSASLGSGVEATVPLSFDPGLFNGFEGSDLASQSCDPLSLPADMNFLSTVNTPNFLPSSVTWSTGPNGVADGQVNYAHQPTDTSDFLSIVNTPDFLTSSITGPIGPNGVADGQVNYAPQLTNFDTSVPNLLLPESHFDTSPFNTSSTPREPINILSDRVEEVVLPPAAPSVSKKRRRGGFPSVAEKQQTHKTRQLGACTRCRVHKIRCQLDVDPQRPCLTCVNRASTSRPAMPCLRLKIVDAALYDKGPHPQHHWSKRWNSMSIIEISEWASTEIKTICVTQEVGGTSYELQVREFIPQHGDALERKWCSNGEHKSHKCATYAISNMKMTAKTLQRFVQDNVAVTVTHSVDHTDTLLGPAYRMALELRTSAENEDERQILRDVLRIWTAIRMESRSEVIIGDETLGMEPQLHDINYHNHGKYLIPPVISAQIELITTATVLRPLKQKVLQQLQTMITDKKKTHWFTIYLCIFILLHSCALLTEFQYKLAIKWGRGTRYVYDNFVRELHDGARIMLIYFHTCNQGVRPFSIADVGSFIKSAGLNEEQARFMRNVADAVQEKAPLFEQIKTKKQMENKYYFLCQLFDENWTPPS